LAGNVGRGHNDGERLSINLSLGLEVAALLPHFVNTILNLLRFVDLG
jgi:hypothetical protein